MKYLIIALFCILTACNGIKFLNKGKDFENNKMPEIEYNDFTVPVDNCPECPKQVDCSDLEYENLLLTIQVNELSEKVKVLESKPQAKKIVYKRVGNVNNITAEKVGDLINENRTKDKTIHDLNEIVNSNNQEIQKKNKEITKLKEDNSKKSGTFPIIIIVVLIILIIYLFFRK